MKNTLGFVKYGNGPHKVLALHDWIGDHRNYEAFLPYLDGDEFEYTFIDLRGYGKSQQLPGEFTADEAAQDVLNLADHLNIETFSLVGHSMTGLVAQKVALLVPDRVTRIVAVTPVLAKGLPMGEAIENGCLSMLDSLEKRKALLRQNWGDRLSDPWIDFKANRWWDCCTTEATAAYFKMFCRTNFEEEAKTMKTPMTILAADLDNEAFLKESLENHFAAGMHYDSIEVLHGCGHYPMQEIPPAFATILERVLRSAVEA